MVKEISIGDVVLHKGNKDSPNDLYLVVGASALCRDKQGHYFEVDISQLDIIKKNVVGVVEK